MPRKSKGSVVVITGASSGIGRATAVRFARKGAKLVLGARRENALREVAAECERHGTRAIPVPTDVRDQDAVNELARQAIAAFGRIDVWVNNAGVYMFSTFHDAPADVYRSVLETNLFGQIHGVRAALPHLRAQGGGVIINNSSILGQVGAPYLSAYAASKFGVRGLSESLREELRDDNIHVCTIFPASIDTPIFQHAANYTGRAIKPIEPVYDVDLVAKTIVALARRPKSEVAIGRAGSALSILRRLTRTGTARGLAMQTELTGFKDEPAEPTPGTVVDPDPRFTGTRGGWKPRDSSTGKRALTAAGFAALPVLWIWRRIRTEDGSPFRGNGKAGGVNQPLTYARSRVRKPRSPRPWQRLTS